MGFLFGGPKNIDNGPYSHSGNYPYTQIPYQHGTDLYQQTGGQPFIPQAYPYSTSYPNQAYHYPVYPNNHRVTLDSWSQYPLNEPYFYPPNQQAYLGPLHTDTPFSNTFQHSYYRLPNPHGHYPLIPQSAYQSFYNESGMVHYPEQTEKP